MSERVYEFRDSIGHVYRLPESVFTLCAERVTLAVIDGRSRVARYVPTDGYLNINSKPYTETRQ